MLPPDRRLRRVRLPRKPCRELRAAGLRLGLDEVPLPGGLRRGAAQQPADGLLRAGADRARRARARRDDAAARRQPVGLGRGAGDRPDYGEPARGMALRIGLRQIKGLSEEDGTRLVAARGNGYRDRASAMAAQRAQAFGAGGAGARGRLRLDGPLPPPGAVGGQGAGRGAAAAVRRGGRGGARRGARGDAARHADRRGGGGGLLLAPPVAEAPSARPAAGRDGRRPA